MHSLCVLRDHLKWITPSTDWTCVFFTSDLDRFAGSFVTVTQSVNNNMCTLHSVLPAHFVSASISLFVLTEVVWNDAAFFRKSLLNLKASALVVLFFFFKEREVLDVKAGLTPPDLLSSGLCRHLASSGSRKTG